MTGYFHGSKKEDGKHKKCIVSAIIYCAYYKTIIYRKETDDHMLAVLIFFGCLSYSITKLVIAVKQRKNGENVSLAGPILATVISAIVLIMSVFFEILSYQMMRGM